MERLGNRLAVAGVVVALVALSILVGRVGLAQDATPGAADPCAVGTPGATPDASPVADRGASPAASPMASPEATPCASPAGSATRSAGAAANAVTIEAVDINWNQKEVTIPANTDVRVMLPNLGQVPHNFSIDALGISVDLPVGQTVETTINAPAGTYEFYCNVPGHAPAGMVGTLIVQ